MRPVELAGDASNPVSYAKQGLLFGLAEFVICVNFMHSILNVESAKSQKPKGGRFCERERIRALRASSNCNFASSGRNDDSTVSAGSRAFCGALFVGRQAVADVFAQYSMRLVACCLQLGNADEGGSHANTRTAVHTNGVATELERCAQIPRHDACIGVHRTQPVVVERHAGPHALVIR